MDLTVVAYATLALSVFVSAVKMGGWILNADPRAIISAGRWTLALLTALALALLVWLVASGRWTAAVLLAAFLLPVFVQAAPRWRVLFAPFNTVKGGMRPFATDLGGSIVPTASSTTREPPDPELVAQSIAVLRAYLQHSEPQIPEQANRRSSIGRPTGLQPRADNGAQTNCTQTNGAGMNGGPATAACTCRRRRRSTCWGSSPRRARRRSGTRTAVWRSCSIRNPAARITSARRSMRPGTFSCGE